jgi:hypothetical protein
MSSVMFGKGKVTHKDAQGIETKEYAELLRVFYKSFDKEIYFLCEGNTVYKTDNMNVEESIMNDSKFHKGLQERIGRNFFQNHDELITSLEIKTFEKSEITSSIMKKICDNAFDIEVIVKTLKVPYSSD